MDPKCKLLPLPSPYVGPSLAALVQGFAWAAEQIADPTGAVPLPLINELLADLERGITRELCARRRSAVEQGQAAARAGAQGSHYVYEAGALEGQIRAFLAKGRRR